MAWSRASAGWNALIRGTGPQFKNVWSDIIGPSPAPASTGPRRPSRGLELSLGALPPPTKKYWTDAARAGMCPAVAHSDRSQSARVPLRVLIAEDSEDDARLLLRELQRAGFDPAYERVDNHGAMQAALDRQAWDRVIGDSSMPAFSGPAALAPLRARDLDTPFIFVLAPV